MMQYKKIKVKDDSVNYEFRSKRIRFWQKYQELKNCRNMWAV